jgi:cell division ATPase FtsA
MRPGLDRSGANRYTGSMEITGSSAPIQGIQRAFDRNAARAKRLSDPEGDPQLDRDMAELPSDKQDVGMQTKVIKAKDQMLGDLLDMMA